MAFLESFLIIIYVETMTKQFLKWHELLKYMYNK